MAKKNNHPIVYSTDPDFNFNKQEEIIETLNPVNQKLIIYVDTKVKGGKIATIVEGFIGNKNDLENLGKNIKIHCGTGGAVKDNLIIIQGNHKEKIQNHL
ncbi:MAG: translation initiation factor, partial [Sediminibacterium sp.]|nr:translation initiation factor [Sediminibacterium sp.]